MSGVKFTFKGRKRLTFEVDDSDQKKTKLTLPNGDAPRLGNTSRNSLAAAATVAGGAGDDGVDPLDAFMAGVNAEIAKTSMNSTTKHAPQKAAAPWEEFDKEDPVASYYEEYEKQSSKKRNVLVDGSDAEEDGQDADPEADGDRRNKAIEPLPQIDHSQLDYADVQVNFYKPHSEVANMSDEAAASLRAELRISATGQNVPNAVASFGHLRESLGQELMEGIRRQGYEQPTPIQAQAIPVALSGSDVIGIAKTGSGKTMAYLLPMLLHAMGQPALQKNEGPIGLVLCPTRELAVQIEQETYKFQRYCGLRSITLAGGLSKQEQFKEVKRGCEIAICNPGRLIDIIKMKGCNMSRVTMVVLDEADRMFDMGFEYQVRSILQHVRPNRQTMLFSATFPPKIERLARDILRNPIRITIGEAGQAAENVCQFVEVLEKEEHKWAWLSRRIEAMLAKGQVLVFVKSIASAGELQSKFKDLLQRHVEVLHGDLDQNERMRIISAYRKQQADVMVATDVAARGLDITTVRTVVLYDMARDIETHTHRVGRTGRAGASGEAFTLLVDDESNKKMAALLVEHLEQAKQQAGESLLKLALKYKPYAAATELGQTLAEVSASRKGKGKGRRPGKDSHIEKAAEP